MVEKDDGFSSAVTWLSGGLVLLTATLTAVGGATGGIARMFRNSDDWHISGALALVLGGALLAVCANLPDRNAASGKPENVFLAALLLGGSMVAFGIGLSWTLNLMINATQEDDRPTLNGQLIVDENAGWQLKIQASASGLRAQDRLQILVYGQRQAGQGSNPSGATLVKEIVERATGTRPDHARGPRWWIDGQGRDLAELTSDEPVDTATS